MASLHGMRPRPRPAGALLVLALTSALAGLVAAGCEFTGTLRPGQDGVPDVDGGDVDPFVPLPDGGPDLDGGVDGGAPFDAGPQRCEELECAPTERCVSGPGGVGVVCEDATCVDDLECAPDQWCDGTLCRPDVCDPGASRCVGETVEACAPNGGGFEARFTCGGAAHFESACTVDPSGAAGCPCEDDWDCPAHTVCDAGRCAGTGRPATCLLEPFSFADVLPSLEDGFPWGGTGIGAEDAVGSPYPRSAQVVMPPLVVNLDDDNGDGLVDERDFPEIVFTTFCGSDYREDGVLRAIHGGGPRKGEDYFASCGDEVWNEGDPIAALECDCADADLNATASLAVGDLDRDGLPEIVAVTEGPTRDEGRVRVYDHRGHRLAESAVVDFTEQNPSPSLANLDFAGLAEIVIGRQVYTLAVDGDGRWSFVDRFEGTGMSGRMSQGPIACVADVIPGGLPEIVAGGTVYAFPRPPAGAARRDDCPSNLAPLTAEERAFCEGVLPTVWDVGTENPDLAVERTDGFCAVADLMGADPLAPAGPGNPPDGVPEVVLVAGGWVQVFDGQDGALRFEHDLDAGDRGGPPNVDDFDGDGFPEIATAAATAYVVVDLQPPGGACPAWPTTLEDDVGRQGNPARTPPGLSCASDADCGDTGRFACNEGTAECVCLHNGWRRTSEDDSSRVTGSSVFDFNGDGRAEVIYNDECFFRIFDGLDGRVWLRERAPSRTRTEHPVVADVDNDGNAEIVFATSNESGFCNDPSGDAGNDFNNGIEVWGDDADTWVPARRIWSQHAYHVTHVTESGAIPRRAPDSWGEYGGRSYDVYRSNPRAFGVAPNLVVEAIALASPDAACGALGDLLDVTARVANRGDVRVGPGVAVGFHGVWDGPPVVDEPLLDAAGEPLVVPLDASLEPGGETLLTARWDARWNAAGTLPDRVRVVADDVVGGGAGAARECREDDNALARDVEAGEPAADLRVELGAVDAGACPDPTVRVTVFNDGVVPASDVRVDLFAGSPFAGGRFLRTEVLLGPLAPGGSATVTAVLDAFTTGQPVTVWAWVDPRGAVVECDEADNTDAAAPVECPTLLR